MKRSRRRTLGLMVAIGMLAALAVPGAALGTTVTYGYAGNVSQQFTVPAGITELTVTAIGAPGGWQQGSTAAAVNGGEVTGTLTGVTPNSVYTIVVGFEGSASTISSPNGTNGGGFNGGGGAGEGGYGGGGASTVCAPGVSPCSNTNGLIVAAGGGGVAGQNRGGAGGQSGGDASPVNPADPAVAQGGLGATPTAGGAGGRAGTAGSQPEAGGNGTAGLGGDGASGSCLAGGGGGGRFGGGGGGSSSNGCGGGGGGSSVGPANAAFASGVAPTNQLGGGEIDISYGASTTTTTTTTSAPSSSAITLGGGAVTDSATVTGNAAGGSPTGNVTFSVCSVNVDPCASGGTQVGAGSVGVTAAAGNTATATSASFTPRTAGTYCFRADYGGDGNYTASSDGSADECVTVSQASSATASTPSTSAITLGGGAVTDSATVTGNPAGGSPTGNVTFSVCSVNVDPCASGGTQVGAGSVGVTAAAGNTATATSASFTPRTAGTYCFRADYGGDGNYTASSDGSADECVTVSQASSATASTPSTSAITLGGGAVTDSATVTGNPAGGSPTGNVTFSVCSVNVDPCASGGTQVGAGSVGVTAAAGNTATATSASFTPRTAGTYCFRADYGGDGNYTASSDGSADECVTVSQASSATASTPSTSAITLGGGAVTDSATVTGNPAGGSPTGNVTFSVCSVNVDPCASGGTQVGAGSVGVTAAAGNTATATSASFTPRTAGTYCFRADYDGDGNYTASSDGSADECVTVSQASSATASTPSTSAITLGGGAVTDSATVTGNPAGGSPTGNVTFSVCSVNVDPCASGGTQVGAGSVSVIAGTGNTATATSASFTPTAAGTYCLRADYDGDANYVASSDGSADECVTVNPPPPAGVVTIPPPVGSRNTPPTVTIASPAPGAKLKIGQAAHAGYTCADPGGPGIASCTGTVANRGKLNTSRAGKRTLTVTATSKDGETTSVTRSFTVVRPPNTFKITHIKTHPNGRVSFEVTVPGPGTINVLETNWNDNLVAQTARLLNPAPRRQVWARGHLVARHAGTYRFTVNPDTIAAATLARPRYKIRIRLWVSYKPSPDGIQRDVGFYGVRIPR